MSTSTHGPAGSNGHGAGTGNGAGSLVSTDAEGKAVTMTVVPKERCATGHCAAEHGPPLPSAAERTWRDRALTIGGLLALVALAWAAYQAYATVNDRMVRARQEVLRGHNAAANAHPDLRRYLSEQVGRLERRLQGIEKKLDRVLERQAVASKR